MSIMVAVMVFDVPQRHLYVAVTVESMTTSSSSVITLITILAPDVMFDQMSLSLVSQITSELVLL